MKCPRCGRPGRKDFGGYCTRVHKVLDNQSLQVVLECANCGRPVAKKRHEISKTGRVFCKRCPPNSGEQHYRWKEGSYINVAGYRSILVGGHYKLEHIHIWEQTNRARVVPEAKAHVHHINFIEYGKDFNVPDNLVLLPHSEHSQLHRAVENGRYKLVESILWEYGTRQLHWPRQIERFMFNLSYGK